MAEVIFEHVTKSYTQGAPVIRDLNLEIRDHEFLVRIFHKLLLNFTWWVNRKDAAGNNVFEGGFLGLDNITVIDRSEPLPEGVKLEQGRAVDEAERPVGPAAGGVAALRREDRQGSAFFGEIDGENLGAGDFP